MYVHMYIIDFEDLNKKSKDIIEITQVISWSYIIDLDIREIISRENNVAIEEVDKEVDKEAVVLDINEDKEIIDKLSYTLKRLPLDKQKDVLSYAEYLLNKEMKK